MLLRLRGLLSGIDYIGFIKRTLVVFVIIGAAYTTYYFIFKKSNDDPKPVSAASVQVALKQHILALDGLSNIDVNDISTPYKIEGIRGNINTSLDSYINEVENFQKLSGYSPALDPKSFKDNEATILSVYDQNYTNLKKLLQYSMISDLGSLDSNKEIDEISARSSIAIDSIQKIAQNQTLSKKSLIEINKSMVCIQEIKSKSEKKDSSGLSHLINNCDKTYNAIKPSVLGDVIAPLKSTDFATLTKNMNILSDEISKKSTVSF